MGIPWLSEKKRKEKQIINTNIIFTNMQLMQKGLNKVSPSHLLPPTQPSPPAPSFYTHPSAPALLSPPPAPSPLITLPLPTKIQGET